MTLVFGQVLQNRYRIVSLLGQGGMGAVYRVWDTRLNVAMALKEMTPQPGLAAPTLDQLHQQFWQEASVLARLDHPSLVRVTDFFEEAGNVYLVMNFVEGQSLEKRIEQKGALPEAEVLTWAGQLLDALAYCHSQGVIHRDVKPQNVIIRPDGRAMLVDFGLVKLWDPRDVRTKTVMRGMGTPEYAPPEQYDMAMGHTDPRSDLYSLGATLYHALTGQAPLTATLRIATPEQFRPLRALAPEVKKRTEAAIMKSLELTSAQRWRTASEMAQALGTPIPTWKGQESPALISPPGPRDTRNMEEARASTSAGLVVPVAAPAVTPRPVRRRSLAGWLAGGLGLIALLLLGSWFAYGRWKGATQQQANSTATALALSWATVTVQGQETASALAAERAMVTAQARETATALARDQATATAYALAVQQAAAGTATAQAETAQIALAATATARAQQTMLAATATAQAQGALAATATAGARATRTAQAPAATATPRPIAQVTPTPAATRRPGVVLDFEAERAWRRGDQPYGSLTRSNEQIYEGQYAGRLDYNFPAVAENFVVLLPQPALSLGGRPTGLVMWVYGNGSGHFLNAWLRDAAGEVRQYTFGRVSHQGWQQMVAWFDENRGWPNSHVSGPDNGVLDYPISIYALVLDGVPDGQASNGVIYLDNLTVTQQPLPVQAPTPTPETYP